MHRKHGLLIASLTTLALAMAFTACGSEQQASLEQRAQSIDKSLICPVCPGETIDQAQVQLAQQMKAVVRDKLSEGWTREQILQFFVDRYGESVLAAPPKEGFNLIAWVVPPVAILAAAVLLFFVVVSMRRATKAKQQDQSPLSEQELEPYLAMVDREMGLEHQNPKHPQKRE